MIKNVRKANSRALLKAELKAFERVIAKKNELMNISPATAIQFSNGAFIDDEEYIKLRGEWKILVEECKRRRLGLLN